MDQSLGIIEVSSPRLPVWCSSAPRRIFYLLEMLRMEPIALRMLSKCSVSETRSQPREDFQCTCLCPLVPGVMKTTARLIFPKNQKNVNSTSILRYTQGLNQNTHCSHSTHRGQHAPYLRSPQISLLWPQYLIQSERVQGQVFTWAGGNCKSSTDFS